MSILYFQYQAWQGHDESLTLSQMKQQQLLVTKSVKQWKNIVFH